MSKSRLALAALFVILAAAGSFAFWFYRELHNPRVHSRSAEYIDIPSGSSPDAILNKLQSAGVIGRLWPLRLYMKLEGAGPRLKAGEYRFASPISPLGVLAKLEEGEQRLSRFTVIEGWTRFDVAEALRRVPELRLRSSEEALALLDDTSLIKDLDPAATNLEGYLYPDTYSFPPNTTAPKMVAAMVQRFRQAWKTLAPEAAAQGRTTREVVTIASLIETEAKLHEERPVVASVIYNRVKLGMPLGIDSTVVYAAKLAGKWRNDGKIYQSHLDLDSPYNTRKVRGLPPGPVASPGARSLEATLKPAATDYLFYVREPSRNDGAHNFYSDETGFQRGVQALRNWERARDAGQLDAAPATTAPDAPGEAQPALPQ